MGWLSSKSTLIKYADMLYEQFNSGAAGLIIIYLLIYFRRINRFTKKKQIQNNLIKNNNIY